MILNLNELKQSKNIRTEIANITGDGTWATVTLPNHNLQDGMRVTLRNTTHFLGTHSIKRINPNSFQFLHAYVGTDSNVSIVGGDELDLERIAKSCEEMILRDCGITYGEVASASEIYDITGDQVKLNRGEVLAVSQVLVSEVSDFSDSSKYKVLTANTDYRVQSERIELIFDYSAYLGSSNTIKITYTCKECPQPVLESIRQFFEYLWAIHVDKAAALTSSTIANNTKNYSQEIPAKIRFMYVNYKRHF